MPPPPAAEFLHFQRGKECAVSELGFVEPECYYRSVGRVRFDVVAGSRLHRVWPWNFARWITVDFLIFHGLPFISCFNFENRR